MKLHENKICPKSFVCVIFCHSVCICQSLPTCSSMRPTKPLKNEEHPWKSEENQPKNHWKPGKKGSHQWKSAENPLKSAENGWTEWRTLNKKRNISRIMKTWRKSTRIMKTWIFTKWDVGDSNLHIHTKARDYTINHV